MPTKSNVSDRKPALKPQMPTAASKAATPEKKPAAPAPSAAVEAAPVKKAKPKLKEADVKKLRDMLHTERARIIEEMRILDDRSLTANMEEGANQQPGFSLQLADSASENMQVETDLGIRSIEAEQLMQIDDALRALATGDYGICQRCNEPISVERLFARPNAKYCINCLKLLESGKA